MRVLTVTNMYPTPDSPSYGAFVRSQVESLRGAGIVTDVLFLDGRRSTMAYAGAVHRILRALDAEPYDLVHAHYGLTGFFATRVSTFPVVVSFCGDDLLGTPAGGGRLTLKSRAVVQLSRMAALHASVTIVKSPELLARLRALGVEGPANIVPNGVDLALFCPRPRAEARGRLGIDAFERVVLFPHTPRERRKRLDLAERAVALAACTLPGARLRIVHHEPQEKLVDEYAAANCMLVTSDWEGSPNVVKEAMAMNLPVVSVDCGDVRERIAGVEGCFLASRDPSEIALGILRALERREPTCGRDRVSELEIGRVAQRVIEVYRAALGN